MKMLLPILAIIALAACASQPAPSTGAAEPVRQARVESRDSAGFFRQQDGSWVEFAPNGLARFRFQHERSEGDVSIILDETRNVRLRVDPAAMTVTEDGAAGWRPLYTLSRIERGAWPPFHTPRMLTQRLRRIWFEGGGGFARDNFTWVKMSPVDGFPEPQRWCVYNLDINTLSLRDPVSYSRARIELEEGVVYLAEGESTEWRAAWRVRAVDYTPPHVQRRSPNRDPDFPIRRAEPATCVL